jgi:hypothetical protein
VLVLRFGLDSGTPRTLQEVGSLMGFSRERARQIERDALAALRRPEVRARLEDLDLHATADPVRGRSSATVIRTSSGPQPSSSAEAGTPRGQGPRATLPGMVQRWMRGAGSSSRRQDGQGRPQASGREVSQAPATTRAVPARAVGATRSPRTATPRAIATTGMK